MTGWEAGAAVVLDSPTARAAAAVVRCRGPIQSRDRIADALDQYANHLVAALNQAADSETLTGPHITHITHNAEDRTHP